MREGQVQSIPTGTAESLELDLVFELTRSRKNRPSEDFRGSYEQPVPPEYSRLPLPPPSATLQDCQELLSSTSEWMQIVLSETHFVGSRDPFSQQLSTPAPLDLYVRRLHFGSPFQIELLLPLLTPAGLAGLFLAAKRLYGIDLEFRTHREQRRVEYLEAKAMADQLAAESPSPPMEDVGVPRPWQLTQGTLRDPEN